MRRRLLPPAAVVLLLLAVAVPVGAGWWILRTRAGRPGSGPVIDRAEAPQARPREAPSRVGPETALRGTVRREPGKKEKAPPPASSGSWTLTFETFDSDGSPVAWRWAGILDAEGTAVQEIIPKDDPVPAGTVEVAGSGHLVVQAHQRVPWASGWLTPPPSGTRHVVVHFEKGLRIAGRVFEQDGVTPLRYGTVQARSPGRDAPYRPPTWSEGPVNADGRFSIAGLPPGPVHLDARAGDWVKGRPVRFDANAGDDDVRLVLGPEGAVAFLIVDEATGRAPRTRQYQVYDVTGGEERLLCAVGQPPRPDPQPEALPTLPCRVDPGRTYHFRVEARGYEPRDVVEFDVPETGGNQLVRVALRADAASVARVTIHVRTRDGALPAWLPVTRLFGQGSSNTTGTKLENERITLEFMPGPQHLSVGDAFAPEPEDPDTFWIPVDLALDLARGEQRHVEVWLEKGGFVVITGNPDPRPRDVRLRRGDDVTLRRARWGSWNKPIETGYFLGALPVGTWTLDYAGRGKGRRVTFAVEREKVTRLDPETFETFSVAEE